MGVPGLAVTGACGVRPRAFGRLRILRKIRVAIELFCNMTLIDA
jgi:hypothetical protein